MIEINEYSVALKNLPYPISINAAFASFVRGNRIIRCKSAKYTEFDKLMKQYRLENYTNLVNASYQVKQWLAQPNAVLNIEYVFYQPKKQCITLKNEVKRSDVFNRVKVMEDKISEALGFDDKFLWSGSVVKVISEKDAVNVTLSPSKWL